MEIPINSVSGEALSHPLYFLVMRRLLYPCILYFHLEWYLFVSIIIMQLVIILIIDLINNLVINL